MHTKDTCVHVSESASGTAMTPVMTPDPCTYDDHSCKSDGFPSPRPDTHMSGVEILNRSGSVTTGTSGTGDDSSCTRADINMYEVETPTKQDLMVIMG